ncbi:MAG TPA: OFA family MFS transporter [Tepidisphaeraceae bacterium]|jgi:MFS family permease|nr:OFA family MFS transporter [Tepidisphaeraceae bacterium]
MAVLFFLDKNHSLAKPGFNRWLVPPAALSIHLAIGQVYALSVFKVPLTRVIGIDQSVAGDWTQIEIARIFSIAIVLLGLSAAVFGRWLENAGPRKAMFASAICFASGFFISAIGVHLHQLWLLYIGYGFIGGIGLGLGYISPVSTLIKWFPDRPGMATGLAIMGFGGGAMIGGPLAQILMTHFHSAHSVGIVEAFVVMGTIYFCFMMFGVFTVRIPEPNWKPVGWEPSARKSAMITSHNVDVETAFRTPQFWMLWVVLCMNVTAGIGIIEQASPMIQEMFKGRATPAAAAGFVGLISLFNMAGRFFWSSTSDYIGRKPTYMIFFLLGTALYIGVTFTGHQHLNSVALFVLCCLIIISMYGGGFATIPAYIRDLFGGSQVSAIHGRILTAWSVAGILGPMLVNHIRQYEINRGVPLTDAYSTVLYTMAGLLLIGFVANTLIHPLNAKYIHEEQSGTEPVTGRPAHQ